MANTASVNNEGRSLRLEGEGELEDPPRIGRSAGGLSQKAELKPKPGGRGGGDSP